MATCVRSIGPVVVYSVIILFSSWCIFSTHQALSSGFVQVLEKEDHDQASFSQWPTKISCLNGIACAVRFMHLKSMAHCDLKCENVMVKLDGSIYHAVLGDFGSACDSLSWDSLRGPVGTVRFMAPELHTLVDAAKGLGQPSPVKADVFSFAFIMWILVSDVEYPDRVSGRQVRKFTLNPWTHGNDELSDLAVKEDVCKGKRPQCREKNNAWYSYYDLMDTCWSQNPDQHARIGTMLERFVNKQSNFQPLNATL
jgi:serine/threonine protein kinase